MVDRENPAAEIQSLRLRIAELEARLDTTSSGLEQNLRSVFDGLFEGIQILDFEFRYIYLNKTAAAHGRRNREEFAGQRIQEFYPGIDASEVFRLMQACMTERAPQKLINHFVYPDGT